MANFDDDKQKKGVAFEATPAKSLNANNTTASNQRAIILQALKIAPQTTINLRHDFFVMQPAPRVFELIAKGHPIKSQRVDAETPDGVLHKRVALYVLHASPPVELDNESEAA